MCFSVVLRASAAWKEREGLTAVKASQGFVTNAAGLQAILMICFQGKDRLHHGLDDHSEANWRTTHRIEHITICGMNYYFPFPNHMDNMQAHSSADQKRSLL